MTPNKEDYLKLIFEIGWAKKGGYLSAQSSSLGSLFS